MQGRWPANIIHDGSEEVLALFPQSAGQQAPIKGTEPSVPAKGDVAYGFRKRVAFSYRADTGSAARFFYCAKASRRDRDEGLELSALRIADPYAQHRGRRMPNGSERIDGKPARLGRNHHPTVKPTALMRYLCRLVTPPGGVVLDPYMGSGSTGKACALEGFRFIGIEREPEYVEIAKSRIAAARSMLKST
jgi:site-specific DNA-methyltransferase (adenine-specific)